MNGNASYPMTEGNLAYKMEPREEIIGGRVVMLAQPTTNHNRIVSNIHGILWEYLKNRPCEPFADGEALFLAENQEEYIPDGMVVCDPEKVKADGIHGAPDLVVEVLSPSTARNDRKHKKDAYEKYGVREYWIVNPHGRNIEQYLLLDGRLVLWDVYQQYPPSEVEGMRKEDREAIVTEFKCSLFEDLTIRLDDVFRRVVPM